MLETRQRIVPFLLHEQARIALAMRHEGDDRHQRERGMESAFVEREPRTSTGEDDVRPIAGHALATNQPGDDQRDRHQSGEQQRCDLLTRIEHRENDEPQRVIGDR